MPSSVIIAAVPYAAGSAAVTAGLTYIGAAVVAAAVGATAATALNGGSWGEQFGIGLVTQGIGAGVSAGIGAAAGSAGAAASEGITQGVGNGLEAGAAQSLGGGLAEGATSGLGGAISPGLESSFGGLSGLEGALPSAASNIGDLSSLMGGAGDAFSGGSSGAAGMSGGLSGASSGLDMSTGAFDSGAGYGQNSSSPINSTPSVPTGETLGGGGLEGFQTNSPTGGYSSVGANAPQLGSGMYNLDPNGGLGFDGSNITGGATNLGDTSLPNAGNDVVSGWQKDFQSLQNGLGDLWDNNKTGLLKTGLKGAASLYDMYAKNKAAAGYDQTLNTLNNMYAPGSPEYALLQQKLDRQNAAAGRRSQSLTNAGNFAAQVAQQRNAVLTSPQYLSTMNARNQNRGNNLSSLFNFAGGMF